MKIVRETNPRRVITIWAATPKRKFFQVFWKREPRLLSIPILLL